MSHSETTAAETKCFPTPAVLTVVTDRMLCEIGPIYEMLGWMTGESLYTHQLPRVMREAQPVLLGMHPALTDAVKEAESVSPETYAEWLRRWIDRYGPEIAVPKLTSGEHERIDPLSELAEKVHPDKIAVVVVSDHD